MAETADGAVTETSVVPMPAAGARPAGLDPFDPQPERSPFDAAAEETAPRRPSRAQRRADAAEERATRAPRRPSRGDSFDLPARRPRRRAPQPAPAESKPVRAASPRDAAVRRGPSRRAALIGGGVTLALIAGGGISAALLGQPSGTTIASPSGGATPGLSEARAAGKPMAAIGLPGVPAGFTGLEVIEAGDTDAGRARYQDLALQLQRAVAAALGVRFGEAQSSARADFRLTDADGRPTEAYSVSSNSFTAAAPITAATRQRIIDAANPVAARFGFAAFDLRAYTTGAYASAAQRRRVFGNADPMRGTSLSIGGYLRGRDTGPRWSITTFIAPGASAGTVTVVVSSAPHLRPGRAAAWVAARTADYRRLVAAGHPPRLDPAAGAAR